MGVNQRLVALGLDPVEVCVTIEAALDEDLSEDRVDRTADAIFDPNHVSTAQLVTRQAGVVAGLPVAHAVFDSMPSDIHFTYLVDEGQRVTPGQALAEVSGRTRDLLSAERTALNFLCRLTGIATHTRAWVDALKGTKAQVLDTRKTTPGLRSLEKYAVRAAGGGNKRMGLYDAAMIKDNHKQAAGSIAAAFRAIEDEDPTVSIQVEVDTLAEALEAVEAGAEFLLLDNMTPDQLREIVAALDDEVELEATGGLTLDTAAEYAATGVDFLSVGALTHSSPIVDIGLDWPEGDE
ncbi:carboxylating nicotinate-nucleotide diphosphorylase [Natronoglycomyces albus]|uniref:carboxylating nicotinate-nucleotide diphosphorylase n=1 Tax=Natronoglycomyces albus TaxID=2811108 RepID=UPI003CCCDD84